MELKRIIVKPYSKWMYEVYEPYEINLTHAKDTIRKGYTTDGASIPRVFWWLYPPYKSEYMTAAVIHDWLCSRVMHAESRKLAYKEADLAFKEALELLNVSKFTIFCFYNYVDTYHKIKCFILGWK